MSGVHVVPDDALGNSSYLVDLGKGLGAVVDPRRDVEVYLETAERHGLRIVATLETHLHADFVTGSLELADATGAEIVASREAQVGFAHRGVGDGDEFALGTAQFRVVATPGHTPEHVSFVLADPARPGVFSGGSLIAGGAARTDLTAPDRTDEMARAQFASVRTLAALPDETALWPTHGAGSFCSTVPSPAGALTIGLQRRTNALLGVDDEDEFVRLLVGGFGSYPPYFTRLRDVNRAGPSRRSRLAPPRPMRAADVAERMEAGAWLVDARPMAAWAEAHPRGAVANELRPAFASWLGWTVPFGASFVLLVDDDRVGEAVTMARRIGYDGLLGWIDGGLEAWRQAGLPVDSVELVDGAEAGRRASAGATLVDVRQAAELAGGRIPGAVHLELGEIIGGKAPEAAEVVVFCGHGERSATAAALLEQRGVVVANLAGGLAAWEQAGLPVAR